MIAAGIDYAEMGEGPAVIFLHGIGGGDASFADQLGAFPGFRTIAWNMPGYGRSEPKIWPPSFASLSQALGEFIEALSLPAVHLVGHSIGGMVALEHTIRRPDQVASLSVIGSTPSFGGPDESFKEAFLKARLAPLERGKTMEQMARESAPALVGPNADEACLAAVAAPMAKVSEKTWRGILECLVTFNRRDDLAKVAQPCCLIAGEHDQNAPPRTMQKMAEKLTDAEYHLIAGAGHMINQEAAQEINAILLDFLRKHTT